MPSPASEGAANLRGMWAITYQYGGTYAIGENVWQALLGVGNLFPTTTVVLPIIPVGG